MFNYDNIKTLALVLNEINIALVEKRNGVSRYFGRVQWVKVQATW